MSEKYEYYKTQREKYVARGVGNGNLHVADEAQRQPLKTSKVMCSLILLVPLVL